RARARGVDRREQRPPQQVRLGKQISYLTRSRRDAAPRPRLDLEQLARIVPLVRGLREIEPLETLEPDQLRAEDLADDLGQLGLADARRTLEQQRAAQLSGEKQADTEAFIRDVVVGREQALQLLSRLEASTLVASGDAARSADDHLSSTRCARVKAQ